MRTRKAKFKVRQVVFHNGEYMRIRSCPEEPDSQGRWWCGFGDFAIQRRYLRPLTNTEIGPSQHSPQQDAFATQCIRKVLSVRRVTIDNANVKKILAHVYAEMDLPRPRKGAKR